MDSKKKSLISEKEYKNICIQWAYGKITTSEMNKKFEGTKYEVKKEEKKQYNKEIKCDCCHYLNCTHCQKRINEEGYSLLDLKGENYWEDEDDDTQSNFERLFN
jgi:hypothetical protein